MAQWAAAALLAYGVSAVCAAQTAGLNPDARRDMEDRPGVVQVIRVVEYPGTPCKPDAVAGTGFLYRPDGYLVTNGHVVQLANNADPEASRAQKALFKDCFIALFERQTHRPPTQADFDRNVKVQSSI